jgi:hypothetical protein
MSEAKKRYSPHAIGLTLSADEARALIDVAPAEIALRIRALLYPSTIRVCKTCKSTEIQVAPFRFANGDAPDQTSDSVEGWCPGCERNEYRSEEIDAFVPDAPVYGHSTCSQNYIDTGCTLCIEPYQAVTETMR